MSFWFIIEMINIYQNLVRTDLAVFVFDRHDHWLVQEPKRSLERARAQQIN